MAEFSGSRIWSLSNDLFTILNKVTNKFQFELYPDLELALARHESDFVNLLQLPPPNSDDRDTIQKADTIPIILSHNSTKQTYSRDFVNETLVLSELFKLNEISAANLLITGENHASYFHALSRGITAVLMYYSCRLDIVNSLSYVLQSRQGHTWAFEYDIPTQSLLTDWTDNLMEKGILDSILTQLNKIDEDEEIEMLNNNNALGPLKHRMQVRCKIVETKQGLANCILSICAQQHIRKHHLLAIIKYIDKRDQKLRKSSVKMPNYDLTVLMAAMYAIQVEEKSDRLPLLNDPSYITEVTSLLQSLAAESQKSTATASTNQNDPTASSSTNNNDHDAVKVDHGSRYIPVFTFAWAVTLRMASNITNQDRSAYDQDDQLLESSLVGGAWHHMISLCQQCPLMHQEQFYKLRIHNLITQFIINMPVRIQEMRCQSLEGVKLNENKKLVDSNQLDIVVLFNLINEIYSDDCNNLCHVNAYWPMEEYDEDTKAYTLLHKFITDSYEQVNQFYFAAYIRMLTSLSNSPVAAQSCYIMLRENSYLSSSSSAFLVSWSHIFKSLDEYCRELSAHRDFFSHSAPHTSGTYSTTPYRSLTDKEIEGLDSIVALIQKICDIDEPARSAFRDCSEYYAVGSLLGMIQCAVPPSLKASLLYLLRALSKSSCNDLQSDHALWKAINDTQLVVEDVDSCGIKREINEIETLNKDYPMTKAFLSYVLCLTHQNSSISKTFIDNECFMPYVNLIRNEIFIKYKTRPYNSVKQKWEICLLCLQIVHRLIDLYDPVHGPIAEMTSGQYNASSPGLNILVHMLNNSQMLQMIFLTIDDVVQHFDLYTEFEGKEEMLNCSLFALKIISLCQDKQSQLLDRCRNSNILITIKDMESLLLTTRYRSMSCAEDDNSDDTRTIREISHVINIAKFICYNDWLPEQSFIAVEIIAKLNLSQSGRNKLVPIFTNNLAVSSEILHGFVNCLHTEEDLSLRSNMKTSILDLIINSVNEETPNMAHFLCGYNLSDVESTVIQHPGVNDLVRNCLHAIISILNEGITEGLPITAYSNPRLAQLSINTIAMLCFNRETSLSTLRYLRTGFDFLYKQIQHFPLDLKLHVQEQDEFMIRALDQQAWLCLTVAMEFHLTADPLMNYGTRRDNKRMVKLLFDDITEEDRENVDFIKDDTQFSLDIDKEVKKGRNRILKLLDAISFETIETKTIQQLNLNYLSVSHCEHVISQCLSVNKEGLRICNVTMLHEMISRELSQQIDWPVNKVMEVKQEIAQLCFLKIEQNLQQRFLSSRSRAILAWKQLTEIIVLRDQNSQYQSDADWESDNIERKNLILILMHELLVKATVPDFEAMFTGNVARILLTLTKCLKNLLNFNTQLNSNLYFAIFKLLMKFMRVSSEEKQGVRMSLYGVLSLFIKMSTEPQYLADEDELVNTGILDRFSEDSLGKLDDYRVLRSISADMIRSNCEMLVNQLCKDAYNNSGNQIFMMQAISLLETMVCLDGSRGVIVQQLSSNGYIRSRLAWNLNDPTQTQQPAVMQYFTYSSYMNLLVALAVNSVAGTLLVLESNCLQAIKMNHILSSRPENKGINVNNAEFESELQFYRESVFFPIMHLCKTIAATLGSKSHSAKLQIADLLSAHVEMFVVVLTTNKISLHSNPDVTEELSLLTNVICLTCIDVEGGGLSDDGINIESMAKIYRLHRAVLSLLIKSDILVQNSNTLQVESIKELENRYNIDCIFANISRFIRSHIRCVDNKYTHRLLFEASLGDAANVEKLYYNHQENSTLKQQSLSSVVILLNNALSRAETLHSLMAKRKALLTSEEPLSNDAVDKLLEDTDTEGITNLTVKRIKARHCLSTIVLITSRQFNQQIYMIENLLFVLWYHLNCYYTQASQNDKLSSNKILNIAATPGYQAEQTATMKAKYHKLKQDAKTIYADSEIFDRINQITQSHEDKCEFTQSVIRNLKRLIILN